jgi:hypothetical protein
VELGKAHAYLLVGRIHLRQLPERLARLAVLTALLELVVQGAEGLLGLGDEPLAMVQVA